MENIKEKLGKIINPVSGIDFATESRVLDLEEKQGKLHVQYKSDGIDSNQKRVVEKSILEALSDDYGDDDVYIFPVSKEKLKPASNQKPAELKVGHGKVGEKRSIPNVKNIIAIGSGKGGVGKSTFTSNLALTLSAQGYKVGIIDADIYGPSLPLMFNKRNLRPVSNENQKIIPLENYGVKFISFGSFIHEDEPVVWRGPMLGGVLNQFFFDTEWGELDYLLIDLPPGTGDVQLSMVQNLEMHGAVIISTPQDMALLDARKALHMFDKMGLHVVGMVENMSSFICDDCGKEHFLYGTGGVHAACTDLGVGFLGQIPLDLGVRKGADFGKPYMANNEKNEGTKIWNGHLDIAKRIDTYFNPTETTKKSLMDKILRRDK